MTVTPSWIVKGVEKCSLLLLYTLLFCWAPSVAMGVLRATLSAQPSLRRSCLGKHSEALATWTSFVQAWKPAKTGNSSERFFFSRCCSWGKGVSSRIDSLSPGHFEGLGVSRGAWLQVGVQLLWTKLCPSHPPETQVMKSYPQCDSLKLGSLRGN